MKSEEFIREVDEELQREQMARLWQRYGGLIVALAVLVVAGTAGRVMWDHWQAQAQAEEAARFAAAEQALQAGRTAEALNAFTALATEADTGYAALARLKAAEAALATGNEPAAVENLGSLGQPATEDRILRELGSLLAASREIDSADPARLRQQLAPLAEAGAPWRHTARELLAVLAVREGRLDEARQLLTDLSRDAGAPDSQQRRAQELLQAIGGGERASS